MNLINVDELLSKLEKMKQSFMEKQQTLSAHIVEYAIRTVKSMPIVEAVLVVRGEWIPRDGSYYCSVCDEENNCAFNWVTGRYEDLYCPKCGADMRKVV